MEQWNVGRLGMKSGKRSILQKMLDLHSLIIRDPNMVCIFPFYQPFITPSLQYSSTPSTINLLLW